MKLLRKLQTRAHDTNGFTLIELVIVVVIVGILTAIAIPSYGAIQNNARQNTVSEAASSQMNAIQTNFAQGNTVTIGVVSKASDAIQVDVYSADPNKPFGADNVLVRAIWKSDPSISASRMVGESGYGDSNDCGGPCVVE